MNKPNWYQPLDLIPVAVAAASAIYAFTVGFEAEHKTAAAIMLVAVPVLMLAVVAVGWLQRRKYIESHTWFPRYGFMIDNEKGGYLLPTEQEFDVFIESVIRSWTPHHPGAERLMKSRVKWLRFRKGMDEKPIKASWGLVKGITVQGGSLMYVDYDSKLDPIEKTALAHELGHVIMGLATGGWDQETHHAFTKKNHLR